MQDLPATAVCPKCGRTLPQDAPRGLCTKCLFAAMLDDGPLDGPPQSTPKLSLPRAFGQYELIKEVARGGMGIVYIARQQQINRLVALKVLAAGQFAAPDFVKRFRTEAEAVASLDHPNIVPIYEVGECEGQPFFSMKFVEGGSLAQRISDLKCPISNREAAELIATLAQAVHYAHQRGILHRDIKPGNVLLGAQGEPHLTDFGVAKLVEKNSTLTRTMAILGTPSYMSPEQARGEARQLTTAVDVYGLGAVLYDLLTGHPPFAGGTTMETVLQVVNKEPRRPSTIKPGTESDLETICLKCLEKNPSARYGSAEALAEDLERWLRQEPILARPVGGWERAAKWTRRHPLAAVLSSITLLAIALSLGTLIRANIHIRAAQGNEANMRQTAESQELIARQRAYASDMNVAKQALAESNLGRALDLLNRQRPQPGRRDLRGWEWRYLWQQTRSDALFTLCQKSQIQSLAISADGQWLAIGTVHKGGLFVWNLKARHEVAHLARAERGVRAAFSPAESLLAFTSVNVPASGKAQATLRLWNAATRQHVAEFPLDNICAGLAFAKDGRTLVTSTGQGQITLWRIPEGTKLASYPSDQELDLAGATGFAATSDLGLAAYGTASGQIRVVDLRNGRERWALAAPQQQHITALAFSPDDKTLASAVGFGESVIRLWDVATATETGRLEGHQAWVGSLEFWPDGKRLASSSADQTIRIWDVANRKGLDVMRGHRLEAWRVVLHPDNETLISGSKDGAVCVWDTSVTHSRRESTIWPEKISNWRFAPDSRSVVTLATEGSVTRWSGLNFQKKEPWLDLGTNYSRTSFSPDGRYPQSTFSADGRFLAIGSTNGNISVWDVSRRVLRLVFKPGDGNVAPQNFLAQGNRLIVWLVARNQLTEWDLEINREIQTWPAPAAFNGFGLSPNERLGVATGLEGDVSVRNLPGHSTTNLPLDALDGWRVTFSPNGERVAVASALGYARVWRTESWREEATLRGFLKAVCSVAFSPDGQRLATGGSSPDDTVKLWDVDSWQELLTVDGTGFLFFHTAFSPDGNALGTLSGHGFLQVWQAPSWEEINAAEAKEKAEIKQP